MRDAEKIELYNANVVLMGPGAKDFEYVGWSFPDDFGNYRLTWDAMEWLCAVVPGAKHPGSKGYIDFSLLVRTPQFVNCASLAAETTADGNLQIEITQTPRRVDKETALQKTWSNTITYRGSYTVVWVD